MDDVARALKPEISGSSDDARLRFERAVAAARAGAEPEAVAEALVDGADPASLLESEQWEALPPDVRFAGFLQVAWLAAERDDDDLTLAAATRALELQPADERALAMAEPLWLESEAFAVLADHYALAATAAESEARARQLLERALHMLEGTPAAAPAVVGLSERLARLPRLREAETTLVAELQSGTAEAEGALSKLGERWLRDGRAREGAALVPHDLRAFQTDASLDLLERLFDQAEDVTRLAEVLQRRVEAAASLQARGRALDRLAAVEHEKRGDLAAAAGAWLAAGQAFVDAGEPDDAEQIYERLLQVLPEHLNAAARLVSLRATAGNFAGAAEAFAVLLRSDPSAPQAGELLLGVAADAERACAADEFSELVDSVRWRLPAEERALSGRLLRESARLFAAQARYDEAAEVFRRLIADGATEEDVRGFQALIDSNPASDWRQGEQRWLFEWRAHHDADRAAVLLEWARFEEAEGGDPMAAAAVLARAAEVAPERADTWRELTRLRLAGGDAEGGLAAAQRLQRLGHDLDAELLDAVLEISPSTRWAVDRRKLSLSTEGRFEELFELYDRAIASADDADEQVAWLDEAAIAARDVAQDRARAVRYWEAFAELHPNDARVDLALERLYEQSGDRRALLGHLARRHARATPEEQLGLDQRIVRLSLEVGAVKDALAAALRAQGHGAIEAEPLLEATFARCAEQWREPDARACGQECAEQLRARYTEARRFHEVARLLRAELSLELGHRQRSARLTALSRLCERKLGDLPAAFDAARAAFLATWGAAERKRVEKLARKLGAWSALVETFLEAADSELERGAQRRLLQRAASIATQELADPTCAKRCYEALFALEPEQAPAAFASLEGEPTTAFEALCSVLSRARRLEALAQALQSRATATGDAELYSRLGRLLADELNDPRAAIDAHLRADDARAAAEVFSRYPSVYADDSAPALALAARLDGVGLPEGAVRVLRHQLAHYGEQFPPARKPVQLALVSALKRLGDAEAADQLLAEAAKRYPSDADVQLTSAAAAAARQDWERAEHGYRTLLLLLHGRGAPRADLRRATVYVELAALKLLRRDESAAAQLIDSGFEAALDSVDELVALTRALVAHQLWPAAERAACQLLDRGEDESAATAALAALSELLAHGREAPTELRERAERVARAWVGRRVELTDESRRSELLAACASFLPLQEAEALLSSAEDELTASHTARARVEVARRALKTGEEAERARALGMLLRLVTHPDAPGSAWPLLAEAYESSGDTEAYGATLERWLARAPRDRALLARALDLALTRADLPRSLDLFERWEREDGEPSLELELRLSALCAAGGELARAVDLLQRGAQREPKAQKKAALLVQAAELLDASGDSTGAESAASAARSMDPACPEAVLLLSRARLKKGDPAGARHLLDEFLDGKDRRRGKALARCLRLAADLRLQEDELSEALPLLVEAHQMDKTDLDTALVLGLLAIDLDRLETAASALRVLVAQREQGLREGAPAPSFDFAQGYLQLARIEQHQGKKTNAKRMALRALSENPLLTPAQRLLDELALH